MGSTLDSSKAESDFVQLNSSWCCSLRCGLGRSLFAVSWDAFSRWFLSKRRAPFFWWIPQQLIARHWGGVPSLFAGRCEEDLPELCVRTGWTWGPPQEQPQATAEPISASAMTYLRGESLSGKFLLVCFVLFCGRAVARERDSHVDTKASKDEQGRHAEQPFPFGPWWGVRLSPCGSTVGQNPVRSLCRTPQWSRVLLPKRTVTPHAGAVCFWQG